ncbi:uncharacterized protein METZ01_LOCUS240309, partial [marine metagenome]
VPPALPSAPFIEAVTSLLSGNIHISKSGRNAPESMELTRGPRRPATV